MRMRTGMIEKINERRNEKKFIYEKRFSKASKPRLNFNAILPSGAPPTPPLFYNILPLLLLLLLLLLIIIIFLFFLFFIIILFYDGPSGWSPVCDWQVMCDAKVGTSETMQVVVVIVVYIDVGRQIRFLGMVLLWIVLLFLLLKMLLLLLLLKVFGKLLLLLLRSYWEHLNSFVCMLS